MKLLGLLLFAAISALAVSAGLRRGAGEWARDLSDHLMMLLLRSTSGFAADVPSGILEEERERRLRWRSPATVRREGQPSPTTSARAADGQGGGPIPQ